MFISYLIQFMDKSVMAQSLIYGLTANLHLVGQQYSWCGYVLTPVTYPHHFTHTKYQLGILFRLPSIPALLQQIAKLRPTG